MSDLARALLDQIAEDPVALERLRELVHDREDDRHDRVLLAAPAYTPRTLAAALGRTERSIRAAIARGELPAVKRGRGYVISASAVSAWADAPPSRASAGRAPRPRRSGVSRDALRRAMGD